MEISKKTYDIKIPVYVSECISLDNQSLFANTIKSLIDDVKSILMNYNELSNVKPNSMVYTGSKNKTNLIGIKEITPIDVSFNTDQCLILRLTAYKTNLLDGYFQNKTNTQKIDFQQLDKLCSNTYFYMLYPLIRRNYTTNQDEVYWQLFIYEDPSKVDAEMVQIGRAIMKKILKTPIKNIKSDKLIEDLKRHRVANVEITLSSFDEDDTDGIPIYVKDYAYTYKLKREKKINLSNMKIDDVLEIYNDTADFNKDKYSKRQLKFLTEDRHTYSVIQEFNEKISETIEDSFNYKIQVDEEEVKSKKIFDIEEIKKHMEGVFYNYLSNNSND